MFKQKTSLRVIVMLAMAVAFHLQTARAATKTWDGSSSGLWTVAANWTPSGAPANGDALVFPAGSTRLITTNSPGGATNFTSLTFTGEDYVIFSPALSITNGMTNAGTVNALNTLRAPVQPRASQTWAVNARNTLVLESNVTFNSLTLTLDLDGALLANGNFAGGAGANLVKLGSGRLDLGGGNNTFNQVRVDQGTLLLEGVLAANSLTLSNGTVFAGVGTVSAFTNAGTLRIGANVGNGLGELSVTSPGAVVFRPGGSMQAQVQGAGHDQLRVANPPNLTHGVLTVLRDAAFPIALGQKFVIITNTGAAAFTTTFTNLPQDAFITNTLAPTTIFQISYTGGSGNDVELTVVDQIIVPTGVTSTWDGGGVNALWSNPTNWVGDVAPAAGNDLLFPPGAPVTNCLNDLPAGTLFQSLRLAGGYTLNGAQIRLADGVQTVGASVGGNTFLSLPLVLVSNQTFSVSNFSVGFVGPIANGGNTLTVVADASLSLNSDFSGTGGLVKRGPAALVLDDVMTYTGPTVIEAGEVTMLGALSLGGAAGGTTVHPGARLALPTSPSTINEPLVLDGTLAMSVNITNRWLSAINLPADGGEIQLNIGSRLELVGTVNGPGGLTIGQGTVVIPNAAIYTGPTTNRGRLEVNGSLTASEVTGTGIVQGTGTIHALNRPGSVSPGTNSTGILTITGDAVLTQEYLFITINGPAPGTGHDVLSVGGAVSLDFCDLLLDSAPALPLGSVMTIVRVGGVAPAIGLLTVNNVPVGEGGSFTNNGNIFRLTYAGGDGNDVQLSVIRPPSVWTGLGADDLWTTLENWNGSVAPMSGADLIFPAGAARRANTNNFAANTPINSITLSGSDYLLAGAPIFLVRDLTDLAASGNNRVLLPLTLDGANAIRNDGGELSFEGGISMTDTILEFSGGGLLFVRGAIAGDGQVRKAGTGTVEFTGGMANTYIGPTLVAQGLLRLNKPPGVTAIPGNLSIGNTNALFTRVLLLSSNQIPDQATVTVNAGAVFDVGGVSETIASLSITDGRVNATGGRLTLTNRIDATSVSTSCVINAFLVLAGGGLREVQVNSGGADDALIIGAQVNSADGTGLRKTGNGRLILTASGVGLSRLQLESNDTFVNGNWADVPVTILGGQLGGTGSCGFITASAGGIAPGRSPGILTTRGGIWSGPTQFFVELNGTNAGTGYDQLVAQGGIDLGGIGLNAHVGGGFSPHAGDRFTIVRGLTAPMTNTFGGIPEGEILNVDDVPMQVAYHGGVSGRDVVLTVVNTIHGQITRLPDGTIQVTIIGTAGQSVVVETTTNLLSPPALITWLPIATNLLDGNGMFPFIDLGATNFPQRFYRVVKP